MEGWDPLTLEQAGLRRAPPLVLLLGQLNLFCGWTCNREPGPLGVAEGLADSGDVAYSLITNSPDFPKPVRGPAQGSPWLGVARSGGQVTVAVASGWEKQEGPGKRECERTWGEAGGGLLSGLCQGFPGLENADSHGSASLGGWAGPG